MFLGIIWSDQFGINQSAFDMYQLKSKQQQNWE